MEEKEDDNNRSERGRERESECAVRLVLMIH